MKLFNIQISPQVLLAEIDKNNRVKFLHPLIKRTIDLQKGAVIPHLEALKAQFNGRTKIPCDDPLFGKALKIQLHFQYAHHPEVYSWIENEQVGTNKLSEAANKV